MFRRRRPLMRAAIVGGGAYAVGKSVQSGRDQAAEGEAPPEQAPAPAPPSGVLTPAAIEELQKLAELQKAGVLTQEEFDDQKRKLLAGA